MNASEYSATERLRDGRILEVRALQPTDRDEWLSAVAHTSDEARYRRFFYAKRHFSEQEVDFYLNVDFVHHVALAAGLRREGKLIGVGIARYVVTEPGSANIAFQVDDAHQGLGIGTWLMRHLVILARDAGLKQLTAEVLAENAPMLKVFERCGLPMATHREAGVVHVVLTL